MNKFPTHEPKTRGYFLILRAEFLLNNFFTIFAFGNGRVRKTDKINQTDKAFWL